MKKLIRINRVLPLLAIGLLMPVSSWADTLEIDGIQYTTSGTEASVTGYSSATAVVIPATVEDEAGNSYTVTSIDEKAFRNCTSLVSIEIPEGVTSIGEYAFQGCTSLVSVEIPESVSSIVNYAFYGCSSLVSIVIPEGITTIGTSTFFNCTSLVSVEIPESVTTIGENAFRDCSSLVSIVIPEGVTTIESYAFRECTSLVSIVISENVASIGTMAISNCSSLEEIIVLKTTPPSIESNTFTGTSALVIVFDSSVEAYESASNWSAMDICNGVLTTDVTDVTDSEAALSGKIYDLVVGATAQGFQYGTSEDLEDASDVEAAMDEDGELTANLEGLSGSTTYYFRTYAVNSQGETIYGDIMSFTTEETTGVEETLSDEAAVEVARYDITGRLLPAPQQGVNIVLYSDGTAAKVIVK